MDENTETFSIEAEDAGQRIDKFLTSLFDDYSRMFLQRLIKDGSVILVRDGKPFVELKTGESIMEGDVLSITIPEEQDFVLKAEEIDLPILFEDEHFLVINKPAGMVVHPGAGVHDGTLVNALLGYSEETFRPMDGEGRPGIVHRLDKETSGVLIVAKTRQMTEKLSKAFANRTVDKYYVALVRGHIRVGRGTLETYIGRSKTHRQKMMGYDEEDGVGKHAITHYKVVAQHNGVTLVKVKIDTGRTHQIRVHMSEMGFPVIGDKIYGNKRLEMKDSPGRHLLHAWRLKIRHPVTGEDMVFTAPLPEDFTSIAENFKIELNG
jgi:23S rRNA pseudouridine1911/1915/1917 synthase